MRPTSSRRASPSSFWPRTERHRKRGGERRATVRAAREPFEQHTPQAAPSRLSERLLPDAWRIAARSEGNTEGTPNRARMSTPGHSSSADSSDFRDFFGRPDPRLPALSASSLDGKEGVDGSSPSEGSAKVLQGTRLFFSALLARFTACGGYGNPLWSLQVEKRVSIPTDAVIRP